MALVPISGVFNNSHLNNVINHLVQLASLMLGRGVLAGLELSTGTDRFVTASAGTVLVGSLLTYEAATAEMPANATRYVFVDGDGVLHFAATAEDPGGSMVCLGKAVSGADSVTVSKESRWQLMRQITGGPLELGLGAQVTPEGVRTAMVSLDPQAGVPEGGSDRANLYAAVVDGRSEIHFVDDSGEGRQLTDKGRLRLESPVVVGQLPVPYEEETLSATKTLTADSASLQVLKATVSTRVVKLPAGSDWGMAYRIVNAGAPGAPDIEVRSSTNVLIATVEPGEETNIQPTVGTGGVAKWPASASSFMKASSL